MEILDDLFTPSAVLVLRRVCDVLLPLEKWKDSKKFNPTNAPIYADDLPWRSGGQRLDSGSMKLIDRIKLFIMEDMFLYDILDQYELLSRDAFHYHHDKNRVESWRLRRGLERNAIYSSLEAGNIYKTRKNKVIIKYEFYKFSINKINSIINPEDDDASICQQLDKLWNNKHSDWLPDELIESSEFLAILLKDILRSLLSTSAGQAEQSMRHAVLVELGERRRAGNRYNFERAPAAVAEFESFFDSFLEESRNRRLNQ